MAHADVLALVRPRFHEGVEVDKTGAVWIGETEELRERVKRRTRRRWEKEHAVPENVEGVEEREPFEVRAQGEHVAATEERQIIRQLPYVLIEDVVDRERLVAGGGICDTLVADLDGREWCAEWRAMVSEAAVARKQAVRVAGLEAVDFQGKRV